MGWSELDSGTPRYGEGAGASVLAWMPHRKWMGHRDMPPTDQTAFGVAPGAEQRLHDGAVPAARGAEKRRLPSQRIPRAHGRIHAVMTHGHGLREYINLAQHHSCRV